MRAFIRHPSDIPIELLRHRHPSASQTADGLDGFPVADDALLEEHASGRSCGVSQGGLRCRVSEPFAAGESVSVRIALVQPAYEIAGQVVWCRPYKGNWDVAVRFLNAQDAYAARMIEQICYIESYKADILRREGRALSAEEAAQEWIAQYAEHFPSLT